MKNDSVKFTGVTNLLPMKIRFPKIFSVFRRLSTPEQIRQKLLLGPVLAFLFLSGLAASAFAQSHAAGRILTVEGIEIVGNSKTSESVIYRYLTIKPGDAISPEIIAENNRRLSQTNFFKEVEFYTRKGSKKGRVVVIVEVKERKWPYFQFEGGHNDLDGWFFVPASLRFDNAFGQGSNLGLKLTLGDRISVLSLWYHNASLFKSRAFIDLQLNGGSLDFIHYFGDQRFSQPVDFSLFEAKLGGTRGFFKHLFVAYRSQTYDPRNFATGPDGVRLDVFPPDIADDLEQNEFQSLILGFTADYRDNIVYPMNGFWGALTLQSTNQVDSDVKFGKVIFDARFFRKTVARQVFAFHVRAGYTPKQAPFFERFYLGGANSLRGFADRRLTPAGWGTKLILTNTEYRFPLSKKNFPYHKTTGAIFFDAGGIWLPGQTPKIKDFRTALGFGLRVRLPVVGIARFDLAFPLRKIDNENVRFHISLGHSF